MMQQTFNDILFNVTQNGEKKELKTVNKTSFFEKNQTDNSSNLLTSPILTNNYFSNLVINDYSDIKENYYSTCGLDMNQKSSNLCTSPLSSGLSSLSSSLTSSISSSGTSQFTNSESGSLLSRSSSTCSLLSSTIINEQQKSRESSSVSSPGPAENLSRKSSDVTSVQVSQKLKSLKESQTEKMNTNSKSNEIWEDFNSRKINWNLLNNPEMFFNQNNQEDLTLISKQNKEFSWNLNRLTELALVNTQLINQQQQQTKLNEISINKSIMSNQNNQKMPANITRNKMAPMNQQRQAINPIAAPHNAYMNHNQQMSLPQHHHHQQQQQLPKIAPFLTQFQHGFHNQQQLSMNGQYARGNFANSNNNRWNSQRV